jgi:sugar-specific transcriptional regulator TrmB
MVYEELEGILTENEQKVYLALLQLGESTAAPIIEKTGLQSSVFYRTIHRLLKKGFVSYILKGQIKHFNAAKPDFLLSSLKNKQEKIKEILPKLHEMTKISEIKTNAEVFVGLKGVLAMYYNLIEGAKPGEEYFFFGTSEKVFEEAISKVYLPFRKYRKEKKIIVYGIHPVELKGKVTPFIRTKERYTKFPLPANMAIFRDKIVIASWGEIPTGILIQGKDIAEQYKELFWRIWRLSKK